MHLIHETSLLSTPLPLWTSIITLRKKWWRKKHCFLKNNLALARHRRNQEHPTSKILWPQCAMFPSCQGRQTFVQVFQCHQLQPYLADYLQRFRNVQTINQLKRENEEKRSRQSPLSWWRFWPLPLWVKNQSFFENIPEFMHLFNMKWPLMQ